MSNFEQDTVKVQARLAEAKTFTASETKRLSTFFKTLQSENDTLRSNLDRNAITISSEIADLLGQVPMRSLAMPTPSFFDELTPRLAHYIETHDAEHNNDADFTSVWVGFSRMQAKENGLMQCGKLVMELAIDNFRLRKANAQLAADEQKVSFEATLGEAPHPAVFIQHIPHSISSDVEAPAFNKLTSIRELQKTTGGQDLVLEEGVVGVAGCRAMAYHPLSTVYFPSFPGVTSTARRVKVADPIAFFDLDNYFCLDTPVGTRLWVKKTGQGGVWVYP